MTKPMSRWIAAIAVGVAVLVALGIAGEREHEGRRRQVVGDHAYEVIAVRLRHDLGAELRGAGRPACQRPASSAW